MEHQHWSYNLESSRQVHQYRHQQLHDAIQAGRESAPGPRPVSRRPVKILFLLLLGAMLLFALAQAAPVPAVNALPTEDSRPLQEDNAAATPAYIDGGGCAGGRGVQTTMKADC